jgi:hypothetical protein
MSEGRNAERFAENFKDQPWIVVRVDVFNLSTSWTFSFVNISAGMSYFVSLLWLAQVPI